MLTGGIATDRKLIFHPVALDEYGQNFIFLLFHFFAPIPLPIPISVKLSIFGLLAIILIILLIFSFKRRQGAINWRRMDIVLPAACLLFFFFYLLFLYISLSFFDAGTPVDWRILSPILVILIVAIFSGMWAISQTLKAPIVWWGFLLFIVLSISIKTPNAIHLASVIQKNGLGYTARQWQESESIAFVRSLPDNVNIYSNGTDVLGFLTGKQVLSIPPKANSGTMMAYPHYDEKIKSMCKDIIENRAFLVYFNQISWRWYLPSQTEIEATCHLPVQQYFGDGTVYGEK